MIILSVEVGMFNYGEYNMCIRKIAYRTKRRALNALNKIAKTGKLIPPSAHAYSCPYCNKWHLGHRKGAGIAK